MFLAEEYSELKYHLIDISTALLPMINDVWGFLLFQVSYLFYIIS